MQLNNQHMLEELFKKDSLPPGFVAELLKRILENSMNSAQVAAALALLRVKGECGDDLAEAAQIILSKAHRADRPTYVFADIVGTGGDGHDTINISTLASLTAASLGMAVAKHGNVSVSSRCGSADVLAELGLDIKLSSARARRNLDEHRWCFLYAPTYHPSFKQVSEVRKELKIKTIFNLLGPLVNPWSPKILVLGVYDSRFIAPCIEALKKLGVLKALVVHGSGLDEIALHGPTTCAFLNKGVVSNFNLTPADLNLESYSLEAIKGALPADNALLCEKILGGQGTPAHSSMICASAGALLWLGDYAPTLKDGVKLAQKALKLGQPLILWQKIVEFNNAR